MENYVLNHSTIENKETSYDVKSKELLLDKIDEVTYNKNIQGKKIYFFAKGIFVFVSKNILDIQSLIEAKNLLFSIKEKVYLKEYDSFEEAYGEALRYSKEL